MNQMGMQRTVRIRDFILVQTGTYQEQMVRPFTTNVQHEHITALQNLTQGGRNLGVGTIEQVASGLLHPDAQPESVASIREGWSSRRFRFLLRVDEENLFNPGEKTQRLYFGYTDHCDASINHLDPQMRIYFNSETVVRSFMRNTPNGVMIEPRIIGSNQIISPLDMNTPSVSLYSKPVTYMIRPEDIFHEGQTNHIMEKMHYSGYIDKNTTMQFDTRAMVGQGGGYKYSKRRDTTPSRYLSDAMKAYKHAMSEAAMEGDMDMSYDREVLYGEAQSRVVNQDIHSNQFFAMLKNHAGYMEQGFVTFRDLCGIFPELGQPGIVAHSMDDGRSIRQVSFMEHSEHWRGSDSMTLAATMVAQVVPAVMMDNFIRSISFAATNAMGSMGYVVDVHDSVRCVIDGINLVPFVEEFVRRLEFDVLAPITLNGQLGFRLSVSCDLAGDSVIDIELDNEPHRRFVAPTFSDSLFTPIITNEYKRQKDIANDILFVLENTIEGKNAPQLQTSPLIKTVEHNKPQLQQGIQHGHYSEFL